MPHLLREVEPRFADYPTCLVLIRCFYCHVKMTAGSDSALVDVHDKISCPRCLKDHQLSQEAT